MGSLEGQTAIVTGASSGIGAATARLLARHGARLILTARRQDRLEALAQKTGRAEVVAGDITDSAVRARIIEAAAGPVSILVNNAGYGEGGPVEEVTLEDARRQLEVNFFAAAELIRAVLPGMRAAGGGRIINISSIAGKVGFPLFGWYCASKFALEGLSDALRLEAAPFGIFVSLVEPGPVATEFFDVAKRDAGGVRSNPESPYAPMLRRSEEVGDDFEKQAVPAERVAAVILQAATASSPRAHYPVGMMAKGLMLALRLLPRRMIDSSLRKQFRMPKRLL